MSRNWVGLLLLLGVVIRFYYLVYPLGRSAELTVDESVYGVQALQILEGARPVFYPAQDYTGSLSAYLSAFLFAIFGPSALLLKVVPFLSSLFTLFIIYRLALEFFGQKVALFSLLTASLGTPFWNNWSSRAGSGYVEVTLVGGLILLLVRDLSLSTFPPTKFKLFWLGLLCGLGFWIQPTIVYFFIPVLIWLILNWGFRSLIKVSPIIAAGFALGALPVVYYNLWVRPAATTGALFKMPWGVRGALVKLITEGFPVLLGGRTSNSLVDFNFLTSYFVYGLFFVSLAFLLKNFLIDNRDPLKRRPQFLIVTTFIVTLGVFLLSTPFNQLSIEPRYVFPLLLPIPIILGNFLAYLFSKHRPGLWLILIIYFSNSALGLFKAGPLSFVDGYSFSPLVSYLLPTGVRYAVTTPAVGHRLTFFSQGKIQSQVRGGGITEARFEALNEEVTAARDLEPRLVTYVNLVGEPAQPGFQVEIEGLLGQNYSSQVVGNFHVFLPQP